MRVEPEAAPLATESLAEHFRLPQLWGRRGFWQIRLRWAVAPMMILGLVVAEALGFELDRPAILAIAIASPLYNAVFAFVFRRYEARIAADRELERLLVVIEVVVDYGVMLLLLHVTGGAASPLLLLLLLHVLVGAIQFSAGTAYLFAALASAGPWVLLVGQVAGWWTPSPLAFRGETLDLIARPDAAALLLGSFTVTLFLAATMVSRIMSQLRHGVEKLGVATAEIERLLADRVQFTLQVAHNLRAPLSAGLGMLELLRTGRMGELDPRQSALLARLDDRLRALDRAAGQLLTIARTRDFSTEIPDVMVDPRDLAAEVRETFEEEAKSLGLRFVVTVEPDLPPVESGVDLLEEMMENLVSNALRYTPEGGVVDVRFERGEPGELRIVVVDTGIGIPQAEQSRLFQEFFRGSNAKRHSPAGTGLGLALVKRTVDRHHGRVRLTSEEGAGTQVVVEIPVRRVGAPAAATAASAETEATATSAKAS
ncbi:MAG: HAMP domain-containing histidine kinase [Acidobacteria bacterium]|nr:HAMP domain-containing histidine kinase [Acidobacteriota bacterium]